ncbi:hypothetical protein [Leptospira kemamanensis]|uniref:hypothetical protein n=1 Tax=Leptospira kemamanensis TaxID=2484942 RepID=UPI0010833631|nr:hypothetical protein [Leptospira kemamanensis]
MKVKFLYGINALDKSLHLREGFAGLGLSLPLVVKRDGSERALRKSPVPSGLAQVFILIG